MVSDLPARMKIGAWFHLTQKTMSVALMFLSILLVPALYFRLETGSLKLLLIDLPIFLAGTGSMSAFYGLALRRQKQIRSMKNSTVLPLLTSLGIALAVNNTLAVLAALFSQKRVFVRTPKTGVANGANRKIPRDYRIRVDHTVKVETALAGYSLAAIVCACSLELYFSVPFLLTFAFGFSYFVVQSLKERYA
jgi:hypothetical protein